MVYDYYYHAKAYKAGKITLAQYRKLQGYKLAGRKNPKSLAKYRALEKKLGVHK